MEDRDFLHNRMPVDTNLGNPGVYLLFDREEIVYVGQGIIPLVRIKAHLLNKKFDSYYIIPCAIEDLNYEEAKYIIKYQPKYNKTIPSSSFSRGIGRLVPPQEDKSITIKGTILSNCLYLDFTESGFDLERAVAVDKKQLKED